MSRYKNGNPKRQSKFICLHCMKENTVMMKWSDLYYENGNRKSEIDTIEEQKTGKITNLPVSNMV